jgi:biotin-dependent carboxylase-like uncharacterized protein
MTALHVRTIGLRATVQDLGRTGLAHLGVPTAGAVDRTSLRDANHLVGNNDDAAGLEIVLRGLTLTCDGAARVAVVGAPWTVDGVTVDVQTSHTVGAGTTLEVGPAAGAYSYLAVAGGIDVAPVLGSRSTDTLAGIGPDVVKVGSVLRVGEATGPARPVTSRAKGPLRVVLGPRDDWFTDDAIEQLCRAEWTVSPSSDRIGLRLTGPVLSRRTTEQLPSEGMVSGAIQVPPDGQPILFLANHPTTGGYPVIAVVISEDTDRAAQHRPGARLRFERTA